MAETEQTSPTDGQSPLGAQQSASASDEPFAQRPELYAGAALLGGFVLAQVLKRLGGDD